MVGFRVVVAVAALAWGACGVETDESAQALHAQPPPPMVGGEFAVTTLGELPATASNGTTFLLVWDDGADILSTRISATGTMIDTTPIAIATAAGKQCAPQVASNGTDYYVVWVDQCETAGANIAGARVTSAGVVDATPLPIATTANVEDQPRIASNGSDYLVVWHQAAQNIDDVYGQLVNHDGTATGSTLAIAATAGVTEMQPAVGSLGGNYLVTWSDFRSLSTFDIYAHRVSAAGVISDPGGFLITNAAGSQSLSAVSSNGTSYLVVYEDSRSVANMIDLFAAEVSADALVSMELVVSNAVEHQLDPAVASNGYDYFTAWEDNRFTQDIYGTAIASGSVTTPGGFAITNSQLAERHTTVSYDAAANGYLLAYQLSVVGTPEITSTTPIAISRASSCNAATTRSRPVSNVTTATSSAVTAAARPARSRPASRAPAIRPRALTSTSASRTTVAARRTARTRQAAITASVTLATPSPATTSPATTSTSARPRMATAPRPARTRSAATLARAAPASCSRPTTSPATT